jgi:hypothetical protein
MSENWQVGDDALCIAQDEWVLAVDGSDTNGPRAGDHLRVDALRPCGVFGLFLVFDRWNGRGFHHSGFIKVTPPADMIEQERREVIEA